MPNIKSAKKRVKVSTFKAENNKAKKSAIKTYLKNADSKDAIILAIKKVDQAAAKGLMHKNCASRKKSQLAKKLNTVEA